MLLPGLALALALQDLPSLVRETVTEVVLTAEDPVLAGRGPSRTFAHTTEHGGTMFAWVTSGVVDPFLRIEDPSGKLLVEVDDGGGGTSAWTTVWGPPGLDFRIIVAADGPGTVEVHMAAGIESGETLGAEDAGRRELQRAREMHEAGNTAGALAHLHWLLPNLLGTPGAHDSEKLVILLMDLAATAYNLRDFELAREPYAIALAFHERTKPETHTVVRRTRRTFAATVGETGRLDESRVLFERVVADYEALPPPDPGEMAQARQGLLEVMLRQGDLESARPFAEATLAARLESLPPDHLDVLRAKAGLVGVLVEQSQLAEAIALEAEVLAACERTLPPSDPFLLETQRNHAARLGQSGRLGAAGRLQEAVLATRLATLPEDHPAVSEARLRLSGTLINMRRDEEARAELDRVLSVYERTLPPNAPGLLQARVMAATLARREGDLERARTIGESVLAALEDTYPPADTRVLEARARLSETLRLAGDVDAALRLHADALEALLATPDPDEPALAGAHMGMGGALFSAHRFREAGAHYRQALDIFERTYRPDHPHLLTARSNLAAVQVEVGELAAARDSLEALLRVLLVTHDAGHRSVVTARSNLAGVLTRQGQLGVAQSQLEELVEQLGKTARPTDRALIEARSSLMWVRSALGDLTGARALAESALASLQSVLPAENRDVLDAMQRLAVTLRDVDPARSLALQEEVVAARERTLPPDHADLEQSLGELATILVRHGREPEAREIRERAAAIAERAVPEGHLRRIAAKDGLGTALYMAGEFERARELQEEVLAARDGRLARGSRDLTRSRQNLAVTVCELGDLEETGRLAVALAGDVLDRLESTALLSPRASREVAAGETKRMSVLRYLLETSGVEGGDELVFTIAETLRNVVSARAPVWDDDDPELVRRRDELDSLRDRLGALAAEAPGEERPAEDLAAEIARVAGARDRLERELVIEAGRGGGVAEVVRPERLAARLEPSAAVVGFTLQPRLGLDETGRLHSFEDELVAQVLRADGELVTLELGSARPVAELAQAWRASLGRPVVSRGDRGLAGAVDELRGDEREIGTALREILMDPVLAAAGEGVDTLHVCPDDLLHLLPLDALPSAGGRLGDGVRLRNEVSFARLLADPDAEGRGAGLLALGGVRYEPEGAPIEAITRGGLDGFTSLPETLNEATAVAGIFAERFDDQPRLLSGVQASKDRLRADVAGRRFVHLATHGWFAPEALAPSPERDRDERGLVTAGLGAGGLGTGEAVSGFAPMLLCGLALSGANGERDAYGRRAGILTAEELVGLDLSDCELAVLSACETNVGLRRAGQGMQSLRTALHAAGARASITSLWKVDDEATRRLMVLFYENLWGEGLAKDEALWRAKRALRDSGADVGDWAAWILTGDPR